MNSAPKPVTRLDMSRKIALTLEKSRVAVDQDKKTWAEILGVSESDYDRIRTGEHPIAITSLDAIARHLNVSLESFWNNTIDVAALAARFKGDAGFLRERYSEGALSRRWSSINILDFVELYFGWELRALALKHLQVSEAVFASPEEMINLRFPIELYEFLRKHGVTDSNFFLIGANSVMTYMNAPLGQEIQKARSVAETYEAFCAGIGPHLEKNCHYGLDQIDSSSCTLTCIPSTQLCDALHEDTPGSEQLCSTKAGVVSAMPGYLGLPFAHVEEITCIHRGDDACRFEADFERARVASLQRPRDC